jgi:molybdopterin/thiamine biosynthesis adenylyltransferase
MRVFDYDSAFRLNYGVFSPEQQERLRKARVTMLGVGGAGGTIAVILARSGIESFCLIDPDRYSEGNLNRQIGCFVDTLGQFKAEVIQREILRINPAAQVAAYPKVLSFDELATLIEESEVFLAEADDLAFSSRALVLAQERKKLAVTLMPTGFTCYVAVFPPDLTRVIHPAELFAAPTHLPYEELRAFLRDPLTKAGRRWYITQGRWRVDWFNRWRKTDGIPLAQICPNVWLGASLAAVEVIKYLTGKGQRVKAPKMWHLLTAENRIKVERFSRRTWLFSKYILWVFHIKWLGIGQRIRDNTARQMEKELAAMEKQESEGKEIKPPFLWRHII